MGGRERGGGRGIKGLKRMATNWLNVCSALVNSLESNLLDLMSWFAISLLIS